VSFPVAELLGPPESKQEPKRQRGGSRHSVEDLLEEGAATLLPAGTIAVDELLEGPPSVQVDPLELARTPEGRALAEDAPAEVTVPLVQRAAQAFGVEPQPIPEAQPPQVMLPEPPAALRTGEQVVRDLREAAKYNAGLRAIPKGNLPAKAEALREDAARREKPASEKSLLELAADVPRNAMQELVEIPVGLGLLIGRGAREVVQSGGRLLLAAAGVEARAVVQVPNLETGELEELHLPFRRVADMPRDLVDELVRLGARFGPEPFAESAFDTFLELEATRLGFPDADELPEGATTFGVPGLRGGDRGTPDLTAARPDAAGSPALDRSPSERGGGSHGCRGRSARGRTQGRCDPLPGWPATL
jgi:hypothetical protein